MGRCGLLDSLPECVYIVSTMQAPLGEFEVVVLMAVLHLGHEANGSAVRTDIEQRIGRRVSRGSVYVTLDRLEAKGLLSSRLIEAPTVRGGAKRLFRATASGVKALKHALATIEGMRKGLEPLLGDR
jgi:PadR family transcriptional regulator, regulatory protein PadR